MDTYCRQAVRNIVRYGDTDIFPFPIENHILHDQVEEVVALLRSLETDVRQSLAVQPPANMWRSLLARTRRTYTFSAATRATG